MACCLEGAMAHGTRNRLMGFGGNLENPVYTTNFQFQPTNTHTTDLTSGRTRSKKATGHRAHDAARNGTYTHKQGNTQQHQPTQTRDPAGRPARQGAREEEGKGGGDRPYLLVVVLSCLLALYTAVISSLAVVLEVPGY